MNIKQYKKLTHVVLKDGRVLISEQPPIAIFNWLNEHSHIMIDGEMHSKFSIVSATEVSLDDLEWFILSQPADTQRKLRDKARWLKEEFWKEMSLDYDKNYVLNLNN